MSTINLVTGTLILVVAFLFHWVGQTFSLLNYDQAAQWGLQNADLPPEMNIYELGIADGDASIGWTYGIAGVGVLLGSRAWGYRMAWFPGVILLYHSICFYAWTAGWLRLGLDFALAQPPARYTWFGANLATALLSIKLAWTNQQQRGDSITLQRRTPFPGANSIAGVLLLCVGFFGHWVAQLISVIDWDFAVRLGLQVRELTPEMKVYEYAFAIGDVAIGWMYGIAGSGLLMHKPWGFKTAWFGLILVYYSINFLGWTGGRIKLGYHMPEDAGPMRYSWFLANLITGLSALAAAWSYSVSDYRSI